MADSPASGLAPTAASPPADSREAVLRAVALAIDPISRSEIAESTGLHVATVSRIAKSLIERGLIQESEPIESPGKIGPKFIGMRLCGAGQLVIGVAVNAYEQQVAITTLRNEVLGSVQLAIADITESGRVIDAIVGAVKRLRERVARPGDVVHGLTVAISGVVDAGAGSIVRSPVLGWRNVVMAPELSRRLGLPVSLINLPDAVHRFEQAVGVGRGSRHSMLINAALGIGTSLILDDRMVVADPARHNLVGDLKMTRLRDAPQGTPLDLIVGGRAVLARTGMGTSQAAMLPAGRASIALRRLVEAQAGEPVTADALVAVARGLGELSAVMLATVNPATALLAGPLSRVDAFWEAWRDRVSITLDETQPRLLRSLVSYVEAATWCAIDRHVLNGRGNSPNAPAQAQEPGHVPS